MNKAKLTISARRGGDNDYVALCVRDGSSKIEFLELHIEFADFAQALTGLAHVECEADYRGLDNVGKTKEVSPFEFEMPKGKYRDKDTAREIAAKVAPEGWMVENYFSSQGSFFTEDGMEMARTTIYRYV